MTPLDQVLRFLGEAVVYGGGSAAVAFLLFQFLGKQWIEARFAERLEAFKHDQAKELQRLKVEVESVLSGALKIQDREFTVLPEAWQKLNSAYSLTSSVASPLQQYPDLARMSEDEIEEILKSSDLFESQRKRVRDSDDINNTYQDYVFWQRLARARAAVGELQNYILAQGVFLPPALKAKFVEMKPVLWSVLAQMQVGKQVDDFKMQNKAMEELQEKAEPLHAAIEQAIEDRLHSHARSSDA